MKLTRKQKDNIKSYWPQYKLRFLANGTILARRNNSSSLAWGVLYTPAQTKAHIEAIKSGKGNS